MKKALITGITGQDGSYLAELLLEKGYEVHGIKRRASSFNTERIDHLYQDPHSNHRNLFLHYGDLSDSSNLSRLVAEIQPDEVYNHAAQSHVAVSFESPEYTADVDAKRDWGHAKDYVRMQWMMLQQEEAKDYVIATGVQYCVREFIKKASAKLGVTIRWEGDGVHEVGVVDALAVDHPGLRAGAVIVRIDPRYFLPSKVETLLGDPSKAKEELGWIPLITLDEMADEMVACDLDQARRHALLRHNGYEVSIGREA